MPILSQFTTPAHQSAKDFAGQSPSQQAEFEQAWSNFVNASVETARLGNPWSSLNDSPRELYFNPLGTTLDVTSPVPVQWVAFPNRINASLFPQYNLEQRWQIADLGVQNLQSPAHPCAAPPQVPKAFDPYGPRGWQDEYCEWAVARDASGKLTSVMFTCENPEYWFLLWNVSPGLVTSLYQQVLCAPEIVEADLYLLDANGNPVIDPQTQRAAYNPINKWNSGTATAYGFGAASYGGAMHLTSPPNSLGAEVYLAAAATIQRYDGTTHLTNSQDLICAAQYGRPGRNSDPHIGQNVNAVVSSGAPTQVTLLDPVGLYLQLPFAPTFNGVFTPPPGHAMPAGSTLMDCWTVVRGAASYPGYPNNAALHLRFEVPGEWGFAVGDITMTYTSAQDESYQGSVKYGAQLVEFLQVQLAAVGKPAAGPTQNLQAVQDTPAAATLPSFNYLMDMGVYQASLFNRLNTLCNLTPQTLTLHQGETRTNVALQANTVTAQTGISFGAGVTVTINDFDAYTSLFTLTVAVAPDAAVGSRALLLSRGEVGQPAPGLLRIVAAADAPTAAAPIAAKAAPAVAASAPAPAQSRLGRR
jgi:hypothetical protein